MAGLPIRQAATLRAALDTRDLMSTTRPYTTNKNAITNCFNAATNYGSVSANQGTYLGTVYASANGQISYTFGASASGGTAGLLGVWNMYNRVQAATVVTDSGASYTYTSSTTRQARASSGNQVSYVTGLNEDGIIVNYANRISLTGAANAQGSIRIGLKFYFWILQPIRNCECSECSCLHGNAKSKFQSVYPVPALCYLG